MKKIYHADDSALTPLSMGIVINIPQEVSKKCNALPREVQVCHFMSSRGEDSIYPQELRKVGPTRLCHFAGEFQPENKRQKRPGPEAYKLQAPHGAPGT